MKKLHILFLFWLISVSAAWGQAKMSLINFRLDESDLSANSHDTEKFDLNGKKCALIKIETTRTGFEFDNGSSAKPTDIQYKKGQIWIYVSPGVRRLNIYHEKLGIIEYVFPIPIGAAKTYKVTLTAKDVAEIETAASVQVALQASDGVEIFMEGKRLGLRQWTGVLKSGDYSVECRKENCYPSITKIAVYAAEGAKLTFDLKTPVPIMSSLSVITDPSGARIWVDGEDKGITPKTNLSVSVGSHRIKLEQDGYGAKELTVNVERGKTTQVSETLSPFTNVKIYAVRQENEMANPSAVNTADIWVDNKWLLSMPEIQPARAYLSYGKHIIFGSSYDVGGRHWWGAETVYINQTNQEVILRLKTHEPYKFKKTHEPYKFNERFYGDVTCIVDFRKPWLWGMGLSLGGYVDGVNIEATSSIACRDDMDKLNALLIGVKTGYGFQCGSMVSITPQIGLGWRGFENFDYYLEDGGYTGFPQSLSLEASLRFSIGGWHILHFVFVPEYNFMLYGKNYSIIVPPTSLLRSWRHSLGLRFGLSLTLGYD